MGNAPCQRAPLWLEGQKKYLDKSEVRKKLSENSTLIQLLFKWEAAASSLGMLHYTFYKLQEKDFHAEPLQKKFCTQAESNSHPPRLQHSTAQHLKCMTKHLEYTRPRFHKVKQELGAQRCQWKAAQNLLCHHLRAAFQWGLIDSNHAYQALLVIQNPLQGRELPQPYFLWSSTSHSS